MRFTNGRICTKNKIVTDQDLIINDGRIFLEKSTGNINDKDENIVDLKSSYILPGFVDIHTHGAGLFDLTLGQYNPKTSSFQSSSEIYQEALSRYVRLRTKTGVTNLYLATIADSIEHLQFCLEQLNRYMNSDNNGRDGCLIKGSLLEGTFLNPLMCGAQNPEYVFAPDIKKFDEINKSGTIKLVNVVPDHGKESFKLTKALQKKGITVGAGHTNATSDQIKTAIENGLDYVIHFLNGPTGSSFKPFDGGGAVEGILQDDSIYVELIVDGFHVNSAYVRDVIERKGIEKIIAVTDAMFVSQAEDITDFEMTGIFGRMSADGKYVYVAGSKPLTLFGSVLTMDKAFSNILSLLTQDMAGIWYREHKAIDFDQAVLTASRMCAVNPCDMLKKHGAEDTETGSIEESKWADLLVADIKGQSGNYKLDVHSVFVRGNKVFSDIKQKKEMVNE